MTLSLDEALDAATEGIGWLVDHLHKVFLGVRGGFRVKRNGTPGSLIFCISIKRVD